MEWCVVVARASLYEGRIHTPHHRACQEVSNILQKSKSLKVTNILHFLQKKLQNGILSDAKCVNIVDTETNFEILLSDESDGGA